MRNDAWVFGRTEEIDEICAWVGARDARGAAVLVGSAGIGKSSILRKFERHCIERKSPTWFVQRAEVNANEDAGGFLHRLMMDTHGVFSGRFLSGGPNDKRIVTTLLKVVPSALGPAGACLGELLACLVRPDDTRPAWQRFCDYMRAVSDALKPDERYVLLIDPLRAMKDEQAEEWLTVAAKMPLRIRVLISQRPDDCIAAHAEAQRHVVQVPTRRIGDLPAARITEWYEMEIAQGRLRELGREWSNDTVRELPARAIERYRGHPFAHDALIRLLVQSKAGDPIRALNNWPKDVQGLLDALIQSIRDLGDDHYRAALTLQVFTIPTPLEVWAGGAELSAEKLLSMVDSPTFGHFFEGDAEGHYRPYHPLFAERLEQDLERVPERAVELARKCWGVVEPSIERERLQRETPPLFFVRAAMPLAVRIGEVSRLGSALDAGVTVKMRLGLLDELLSDLSHLLESPDESWRASAHGNLGLIYGARGELEKAEEFHRKALAIEEKLGRLEGMAREYGHLGLIYRTRGELEKAEEFHRKALAIDEKLGRLEGMASQYGNLGLIYQARGELEKAEEYHRLSLAINEKLGRQGGLAAAYGNLGLIYQTRGELEQAEEFHRKALAIHEKLGRPEGMACDYGNLGLIYRRRGELEKAEEFLRQALAIEEKLGRPEGMANAYSNLGLIYGTRAELEQAEELHRKALAIEEKLGRPEGMAIAYGNLGLIHRTRGELEKAEEFLRKALAIEEKLGRPEGMASEYGNLGLIYETRGELEKAEEFLRKALAIEEKLGRPEGMAIAYGNLGLIHRTRGELKQAEEFHRQALAIEEKLGQPEGMASDYSNLGVICRRRGELGKAEEFHRKALAIHEKLGRLEGMATAYGNLGLIYQMRGELEQAEEYHRQSLAIEEKLGRQEGMACDYGNLGLIYETRGELEKAEEFLRKSLAINAKLGRPEGMANQYGNLGVIYQTRGELEKAEEFHRKALAIDEKLGRQEGMATQYGHLGAIAARRGSLDEAREWFGKAMELYERIGMSRKVDQVQEWIDWLEREGGR